MSTTEPTDEPTSLEALVGSLEALSIMLHDLYPNSHYPDDLDEAIHLLSEAGQSIAALAVAPAPSDDDREAVTRIIEATASVRAGEDDYEIDNADEVSGRVLDYLARRSAVSPPEDVAKLIEREIARLQPLAASDGLNGTNYGGTITGLEVAGELTAALRAPVPVETGGPKRLDPAFRADLIDFARHRIQQVWTDVPGGVDAATLASNIVAAQEFCWMSRQVPVAVPVETVTTERAQVITLCGSTRFKDEFMAENQRLTMEGNVVISLGLFGHTDLPDYDWTTDATDLKRTLDRLHFQKIDMADRVHVINVDGYIGESTQREIAYARSRGKQITYLFRPTREEGQ